MLPRPYTVVPPVLLALVAALPTGAAHRRMDGASSDWCYALDAIARVEDTAGRVACGRCDHPLEPISCLSGSDCPVGQACLGSQEELVWYDARTDSVANDLRTVSLTQDTFALYLAVDWHTDLDPVTLVNTQIAIDFQSGGTHELFDPHGRMVRPGACSESTDRACTEDADCHFCTRSYESPPCCDAGTCEDEEECRVRICGSGCNPEDPLDVCDTGQVCQGVGTTPIATVGVESLPATGADYLITIDLGRYLVGLFDCFQLSRWTGQWTPLGTFEIGLPDPGVPGESDYPFFETTIPWDAFGCTGWTADEGCGADPTPAGCGCLDFGPGTPFVFTTVASRAWTTLDFAPWGAIEDVASEAVAGTTTRTPQSCPGAGIGTTRCEIDDDSIDTFGLEAVSAPGGTTGVLRVAGKGAGPTPSITLRWNPSCSYGDVDYEVYEGGLAALPAYDHEQKLCSTARSTTATFEAGPGDRYFVVVPTDGTIEGSYGTDSSGAQRPRATPACRTQLASATCP